MSRRGGRGGGVAALQSSASQAQGPCNPELTAVKSVCHPTQNTVSLRWHVLRVVVSPLQECTCFRSAQLPLKLVFRTSLKPIDWASTNPLAPSAASAAPAWLAPAPAGNSPTASSAAAEHTAAGTAAAGVAMGSTPLQQQAGLGQQQQWSEQHGGPDQQGPSQQQQRLPAATPYGRCVVIYKKGDDLRQDQFILQVCLLRGETSCVGSAAVGLQCPVNQGMQRGQEQAVGVCVVRG
jgi:hypothetical protein